MFTVIFPSDYFNKNKVEETFENQAEALSLLGIEHACINIDDIKNICLPKNLKGKNILYRGWMLTRDGYEALYAQLLEGDVNMLINPTEYIQSHYLPSWYDKISDLTPETVVYDYDDDMIDKVFSLEWGEYFIKDYVKSLSTEQSPIVKSKDELQALLLNMEKFRDGVEGGVCVRRVEQIAPESERRYFVLNGVPFGSEGCNAKIPDIVSECASRLVSKFYAVDIVKNKSGVDMVIEIGDGQVSDLKEWSPERFCKMLMKGMNG
tara:strand:+ start:14890 stop:15681 length:792 start_codon:yes stop_codon:yes gene_type:complete